MIQIHKVKTFKVVSRKEFILNAGKQSLVKLVWKFW